MKDMSQIDTRLDDDGMRIADIAVDSGLPNSKIVNEMLRKKAGVRPKGNESLSKSYIDAVSRDRSIGYAIGSRGEFENRIDMPENYSG